MMKKPALINFRVVPNSRKLLFRSGTFQNTTNNELQIIVQNNGIKIYVDFRSKAEINTSNSKPRKLIALGVQWINLEIKNYEGTFPSLSCPTDIDYVDYCMRIMEFGRLSYKKFLLLLTDKNNLPLVFGCYSGKDRTGIASILVLSIINLSQVDLIADFLLTNTKLYEKIYFFEENWQKRGLSKRGYLKKINISLSSLELLFQRINSKYGGILKYIENELGIDIITINKIRENLKK